VGCGGRRIDVGRIDVGRIDVGRIDGGYSGRMIGAGCG